MIAFVEGFDDHFPIHRRDDGFIPSEPHLVDVEILQLIDNGAQVLEQRLGGGVHIDPDPPRPLADLGLLQVQGAFLEVGTALPIVAVVDVDDRAVEGIAPTVKPAEESLGNIASRIVAQTAAAVSETSVTVQEVRQTVQLASQKARSVSEGAQHVEEVSHAGRRAVEEVIAGMERIREQVERHAATVGSGGM